MFRRDPLLGHVGDRVFFRLTSGTQLSGIVVRVTPNTPRKFGEVELARVRAVVPGPVAGSDTWQEAAEASTTGFDRSRVDYWQHIVTVVEPAPQVTG